MNVLRLIASRVSCLFVKARETDLTGYLGLAHKLLDKEVAAKLLAEMAAARDGGETAKYHRLRNRVVAAHLRFALSVAKRFANRGVPLEDLINEAASGIARACDTFEPRRDIAFTTYASWWGGHRCRRAVSELARQIRLPVHVAELRARCVAAAAAIESDLGRAATVSEIAARVKAPISAVKRAVEVTPEPVSLDAPRTAAHHDDCDITLHGTVADDESPDPLAALLAREREHHARELLSTLTPRERVVVAARAAGATLSQAVEHIPRIVGGSGAPLTRERARQIQVKAFGKLRAHARRNRLAEGLSP